MEPLDRLDVPYGYRYQLVAFEQEHIILRRIIKMYMQDNLSQKQIVERLNKEGVTCRGKPWHQGSISKIIARELPAPVRRKRHLDAVRARRKPTWRELAWQRHRERQERLAGGGDRTDSPEPGP